MTKLNKNEQEVELHDISVFPDFTFFGEKVCFYEYH